MITKRMAVTNDERIQDLAMYSVTRGLLVPVKSGEELRARFTEYKMLIKRGSFTIDELEDDVFDRYGVMGQFKDAVEAVEWCEKNGINLGTVEKSKKASHTSHKNKGK